MDIHYGSNKLKKALSSDKAIAINYGRLAVAIKERLSEFDVASDLGEISINPPPLRHKLEGGNRWAVSVSKNYRLVFEGEGSDPSQITSITIVDICDYH